MLSRFQEVKEELESSLRRISILVPQELGAQVCPHRVHMFLLLTEFWEDNVTGKLKGNGSKYIINACAGRKNREEYSNVHSDNWRLNSKTELCAQISAIQVELSQTQFQLDPVEKQIGADIISLLLQKQKGAQYENPQAEQETFGQLAIQLGLVSADAILVEKRALKCLLDRARYEEDSRKEAVTLHILQLMKKFNNVLHMENDLQCSGEPARWLVSDRGWGSSGKLSVGEEVDGQLLRSFQSYLHCAECRCSDVGSNPSVDNHGEQDCSSSPRTPRIPLPPEELRCPISLQLMSDPVIVSSGQTYERVCIEKWFQVSFGLEY